MYKNHEKEHFTIIEVFLVDCRDWTEAPPVSLRTQFWYYFCFFMLILSGVLLLLLLLCFAKHFFRGLRFDFFTTFLRFLYYSFRCCCCCWYLECVLSWFAYDVYKQVTVDSDDMNGWMDGWVECVQFMLIIWYVLWWLL